MNRTYKSVFPNGTPSAYIPGKSSETSVKIVDEYSSTFGPNSVTFFTPTTGSGVTGVYSGGPTGYTKEGNEVVLKNSATGSAATFTTNIVNSVNNAEVFDHPNSVASATGYARSISYTGYNAVTWIFDSASSRYVITDRF